MEILGGCLMQPCARRWVNAVCHRDYLVEGTQVTVEIFDDRVEIYNPGGLPKGLKPEEFGAWSACRNPLMASLLLRCNYIEKLGAGIGCFRSALKNASCPNVKPSYSGFFTLEFSRPSYKWADHGTTRKTTQRILDFLSTDPSAGRKLMNYYTNNAKAYVESTLHVDMQPLYQRFLRLLPERAYILDAGCGSGRDARYFVEHGYQVTAFDASVEIAVMAEREIGQIVQVQRFQDIQYQNQFDGIWACASLLHVPTKELSNAFHRLAHALKPEGVIYCSFKYGQGEYEKEGRRFTDMDEAGLRALVGENESLVIKELWATADRRPGREHERWLNAILSLN